ncbi:MAG: hypothetical protein QXP81_02200 [Nitrososphaerota archaeon]
MRKSRSHRSSPSSGVSPAVSTAILASVTVAIGILLMAVSFNWFGASATDLTQKTDRSIHLVRTSGMLVFEMVKYPLDVDKRNVRLRNIATVDLCVVRLELIREDGSIGGQYPSPPQRWLACGRAGGLDPIPPKGSLDLPGTKLPGCPTCFFGERTKLRVWYIARNLYDQNNPEVSADEMQFVETVIIYPGLVNPEVCVPPEGTPAVFLASVDPVTNADNGEIRPQRSDKLYVSFRHASPSVSTPQSFTFVLADRDSSGVITSDLRIDTSAEQPVRVTPPESLGSIIAPFSVDVSSPTYTVIPNRFYFGSYNHPSAGVVHVSGVRLITQFFAWVGEEPIVTTVMIELAKKEYDVPATVPLRLKLIDCNNNVLAQVTTTVTIPSGVQFDSFFIDLPTEEPVLAFKVYRVEVEVG